MLWGRLQTAEHGGLSSPPRRGTAPQQPGCSLMPPERVLFAIHGLWLATASSLYSSLSVIAWRRLSGKHCLTHSCPFPDRPSKAVVAASHCHLHPCCGVPDEGVSWGLRGGPGANPGPAEPGRATPPAGPDPVHGRCRGQGPDRMIPSASLVEVAPARATGLACDPVPASKSSRRCD